MRGRHDYLIAGIKEIAYFYIPYINSMTREHLIKKTIDNLSKLPDPRLKEVADFAEFLLNKLEDKLINEGIQKLATDSKAFQFLEEDEELYSKSDLKEVYR